MPAKICLAVKHSSCVCQVAKWPVTSQPSTRAMMSRARPPEKQDGHASGHRWVTWDVVTPKSITAPRDIIPGYGKMRGIHWWHRSEAFSTRPEECCCIRMLVHYNAATTLCCNIKMLQSFIAAPRTLPVQAPCTWCTRTMCMAQVARGGRGYFNNPRWGLIHIHPPPTPHTKFPK